MHIDGREAPGVSDGLREDGERESIGSAATARTGSRVRMNAFGRERHPKYGRREGLIVGRGSPSSWRVKFDQSKTVQSIYHGYLEVMPGLASMTNASLDSDRTNGRA